MNRRWLLGAVCGLAMTAAGRAAAQGYGLPVIDDAEPREPGYVNCAVGANIGVDRQFCGARATTTVQKGLRLFADVGAINPDKGSIDLAAQVGALAILNIESTANVAVRASLYGTPGDKMDVFGGTAMVLGGGELAAAPGVCVYSGLGLDVRNTKTRKDAHLETIEGVSTLVASEDTKKSRVYPLWAIGTLMSLSKDVSFFAEFTISDRPFVGVGFRFQ